MKNQILIFCALFAGIIASAYATDDNVVFGYTGLMRIPTASVIPDGYLDFQYNRINYQDITGSDASNINTVLGIFNRVELGATSTFLIKPHAKQPEDDLAASVKIQLINRLHFWDSNWSFSAGWSDLGTANTTPGAQTSEARYIVGTVDLGKLSGTLGYGIGPERLKGVFGGIAYTPIDNVTLMADYDGDFTTIGVKLAVNVTDAIRAYEIGSHSFHKDDPNGTGLGGRFNLRFDRGEDWFSPDDQHGLRALRLGNNGEHEVVSAENVAFLQRQSDSAHAACAAADAGTASIDYWQYRYGIPLVSSTVDCDTGEYTQTSWLPQFGNNSHPFRHPGPLPYWVEIRLGAENRDFLGVEDGQYKYSTALQTSARLQAPYGLGAYITYNAPRAESEAFKTNGPFQFYSVHDGVREYAAQWAFHPVPGLIGVGTIGNSYVNEIAYNFAHLEETFNWGSGANQTRAAVGEYQPSGQYFRYAARDIAIVSERYWYAPLSTAVEAGAGEFFYGDKGGYLDITRYFGDITVTLFGRRQNSENQVVGLSIGIPLTPRMGFQRGPISLVGMPRFTESRDTSFGGAGGNNKLLPMLLVEPSPVYNLRTDWLDSNRISPAYLTNSNE